MCLKKTSTPLDIRPPYKPVSGYMLLKKPEYLVSGKLWYSVQSILFHFRINFFTKFIEY